MGFELKPRESDSCAGAASKPSPALGSIWLRAQLVLQRHDACARMNPSQLDDEIERRAALRALFEAEQGELGRRNSGGMLAGLSQARDTGKLVLNYLGHTLDWVEIIKNALNWTHPQKTRYIFQVLFVLTVASALIPTRYIVLVIGMMEFIYYFLPKWYLDMRTPLVDRITNMVASVPSDRRLREIYRAENERFLRVERNSSRYARSQ